MSIVDGRGARKRFHNQDAAVAILIALYLRRVTQWWSELSRNAADQAGPSSLREALVRVGCPAGRQFDELRYVMRPVYLQSRLMATILERAGLAVGALAAVLSLLDATPGVLTFRDRRGPPQRRRDGRQPCPVAIEAPREPFAVPGRIGVVPGPPEGGPRDVAIVVVSGEP